MERVWTFDSTAVTATLVDFADPALAGQPDVRERGVRLEVRPARWSLDGSVYSSPSLTLDPGVLRVDLLESSPGAADRFHWHPEMHDGEPGGRVFDTTMVADPTAWLRSLLTDLADRCPAGDAERIAVAAEEVVGVVDELLARARQPWPDVTHDERGLAVG